MTSLRIPQPNTIEEAERIAIGARVATFWRQDYNEWFEGRVIAVLPAEELDEDPEKPDDVIEEGVYYCNLTFHAQKGFDDDAADMAWNDVFNCDDAELLELPIGGQAAFPHFVPPTGAARRSNQPRVVTPRKRRAKAATTTSQGGPRQETGAELPEQGRAQKKARSSREPSNAGMSGQGGDDCKPDPSRWPGQPQGEEAPSNGSSSQQQGAHQHQPQQQGGQQQQQQQPHQQASQQAWGSQQQPGGQQRASQPRGASQRGHAGAGGGARASQHGSGGRHGNINEGYEEDDDFREQQPTQRRGRPPRAPPAAPAYTMPDPPGAPPAGNIKSLHLVNFMCHAHYEMDFNANVNLITGDNGSGKSSVLQALQCCLGARATDTGRFSSLKDFVRHGEAQAVVKVTLWNTGPDAYKRAQLGPELTVVRKINATSGGSYDILDCAGRTALRGTGKVHDLIDALSINASNPAIVLTQDMAKSFAGERSEGDKFRGFMQATEFDKVVEHLMLSNERITYMQQLLKEHAAGMEQQEDELANREELVEQMKEVKSWQEHHDAMYQCLAWAPVYETERHIAMKQEGLEVACPAKQHAVQSQLANYQQQLAGIDQQLDEQQRQLQDASAAMEGREAQLHQLREAVKAKRKEVHQWQQQLKAQQAELQELQDEKQGLEDASKDTAAEYVRSTQQQVASHRQRVQQCRDQCERAGVAASNARQYLNEREAAVGQAREEQMQAERALVEGQQRKQRAQGDLRRLQASQEAPLTRFGGPGAVELSEAVLAAVAQGRFSKPPILIGSMLSLSDDRWAVAVEAAMGRQLNTWIVNNQADATLLKSMRRQLRQPLQGPLNIVVMAYHHPLHNIPPGNLLPEDVVTCLRVLRFQEGPWTHVVKNVLIDHAAIERTVLTHTHAEALDHARNASSWGRYRIANAYAKDGSKAYRRGLTETSLPPDRQYRPRLVRDLSQQLAQCRSDLQEAEAAVTDLQQQALRKRELAQQAQQELQAARQKHQGSLQQKQTLDTQYQQAMSQQPLEVDAAEDGSEAAQRLAQLSNQIAEAEARLDATEDSLAAAQREHDSLAQRQQEARAVPQLADTLAACRDAITELAASKEGLQAELAKVMGHQRQLQEQTEQLRVQVQQLERELAGALGYAERICSRDEEALVRRHLVARWRQEGHSDEAIAGLLDQQKMTLRVEQLERKIHRRQADANANLDDLEIQVLQLRNKLHKQRLRQAEATANFVACQGGQQIRRKKFKELRTMVASALSKAFQRYMGYRHHRGSIEVDYRTSRLIFRVGIGGSEPTDDMKALSGGERSLSSLAFILALGHVGVNPPFHALDEFDVFMDSVNRRLALAFLLEFAHRQPERQILLLTPQDISVLEEAKRQVERQIGQQLPPDFVKVHRMRKPRP